MSGEASPAGRWRRLRRLGRPLLQLALLALAGYLVWRSLHIVRWAELRGLLVRASPRWTLVGILFLVLRYVAWDVRWRLALRYLGPLPPVLHSFFTLLSAFSANAITPTARVVGGLLRARHIAGRGDHTFGRVYGVVLFDQIAHQTVMAATGWMAFIGAALWFGQRALAVVAAIALVAAATVVSHLFGRFDDAQAERLAAWLESRRGDRAGGKMRALYLHGQDAVRVLRQLLGRPHLRLAVLLLGLAYVLLNALGQWALFRALGRPLDLLTVLVAVTAGIAVGGFTGTPGGVGTTEAGMILTLVALEVPRLDAAAGTLLYRGLHYALILGLGLPATFVFEARLRRRLPREEGA
ncbi:MAG TPA: lysylphosphatidylglycerol synthase transmembrane domain-containing protein [Thermoanaerobaculia bacterium]|nr:lysylphosphatidylglycerol synthase transmembrane domain-containing protein [Thermoanaerobaculia bacterium]